MEYKQFISQKQVGETVNYLYHRPANAVGKLPLVLYIHGAGSRGSDVSQLEQNSGLQAALAQIGDRCVVMAPQCHRNFWFDLFTALVEFIDMARRLPEVDADRVIITGASMGGYTTWQLILSHPDWFAAAMPICGGGMYWSAGVLKNLPVWAFHGAKDPTVLCEETIKMVRAVNNAGGHANVTIFPEAEHNAWVPALSAPDTWTWAMAQKR